VTLRSLLLTLLVTLVLLISGCNEAGDRNPVTPDPEFSPELTSRSGSSDANSPSTHLWGYYQCYFDIENRQFDWVLQRGAMLTVNVVNFLNTPPSNLGIVINRINAGSGYIDIDVDVSLRHPFPGMDVYNGYDVRGVFCSNSSSSLEYNTDLEFPVLGTDQYMLDDPVQSDGGGPDGYTRWFNPVEFPAFGLFGYTPGAFASPEFSGDATLSPYKYYADDFDIDDNLWEFLTNTDDSGIFSAGSVNKRNYYLRFPDSVGVEFGYVILANWEGVEPEYHPSNAPEAIACNVTDNSTLYYTDPANNGGSIILDIGLFDWNYQPSTIFIESTVLNSPHEFTPTEMNGIGGGENYSVYHVDLESDSVTGTDDQEYWVIAQYNNFDYGNGIGAPNLTGGDPVAAFFRYSHTISGQTPTSIVVTSPNGGEEWKVASDKEITWTSQNVTGTIFIEYSKDNFTSDINEIAPDEPNDGSYMWLDIPDDPSTTVRVRISSTGDPGINDISDEDFTIYGPGWARTWGDIYNDDCRTVNIDDWGNIYVAGDFWFTVDFDPGDDVEERTALGYKDAFLSKFDQSGNFLWVQAWGGVIGYDRVQEVVTDSSGDVYVTGMFNGLVDFDPGDDVEQYNGVGEDIYLSKFDSDGNFLWVITLGANSLDHGYAVALDSSGNPHITGLFNGTVDFDPGSGYAWRTSNGYREAFLGKYSPSGDLIWVAAYGGPLHDYGYGVIVDSSDNVYASGMFSGTVDFDPGGNTEIYPSHGGLDAYLTKFDSSGDHLWARTWGASLNDNVQEVELDGSGNAYVTGTYQLTVDFDPGGNIVPYTSNGLSDAYVSSFNPSGDFQWARAWGGTNYDAAYGVVVDDSFDVYVAGWYDNTVDFDPEGDGDVHVTNGSRDVYLTKFDSAGDHLWARTWGDWYYDYGQSCTLDNQDNIYVSGYYYGTVDFDPGSEIDEHSSDTNSRDAFVVKFLPDGYW